MKNFTIEELISALEKRPKKDAPLYIADSENFITPCNSIVDCKDGSVVLESRE